MNITVNRDSWFSRNVGWLHPLLACLVAILAPMIAQAFLEGSVITIPGWASMIPPFFGCFGFFIVGLKVRLTDTLTAKLIYAAIVVLGFAVAIYQLVDWLRH